MSAPQEPTLQDTVDAAQDFLKMATAARDAGTFPGPEQASDLIDVGNDLLGAVAQVAATLQLRDQQFAAAMVLLREARAEVARLKEPPHD